MDVRDIRFPVFGEQKLAGTLVVPDKPNGHGILISHGWRGRRNPRLSNAQMLAEKGFTCLTYDLRGHGESDGKLEDATIDDNTRDLMAAYHELFEGRGIEPSKRHAVSGSYSVPLTLLAMQGGAEFASLVFRAPAIYPANMQHVPTTSLVSDPKTAEYREQKLTPKKHLALMAASRYEGRVLLIESKRDEIVPHQTTVNYLAALKQKTSKLEYRQIDAAHRLEGVAANLYQLLLLRWFLSQLEDERTISDYLAEIGQTLQ